MPARIIVSSSHPPLSPPRFYVRPSPHAPSSSHPHRDIQDDRSPDFSPYDVHMPPQNVRPDADYTSHSGWSTPPLRVYPDPSSIPPHWIHPATLTQFRDGRAYVTSGTTMQVNPRIPWQNPYTRVVQAQQFVAPPPPPIPHKVWILDCKSCGMFLTNRGMKAVLLLRPNVPLYSTDALPINCSAFSSELESPTHSHTASVSSSSSSHSAPRSARSSISGPSGDPLSVNTTAERPPTRTCECLTQTLCCHGCGNAVGYMIVTPCQRCTSSITVNNRATNGHRFVFYSSEITACERYYVLGERGVSPFHPVPTPSPHTLQTGMAGLTIGSSPTRPTVAQQPTPSPPSPAPSIPPSLPPLSLAAGRTARRTSEDYLPTPPPDAESPLNARPDRSFTTVASPTSPRANVSPSASASQSPSPSRFRSGHTDDTRRAVPPVPPNSHSTSPHTGNTPAPTQSPSPVPLSPSRARAASASAAASTAYPSPVAEGFIMNGTIVPTHLARQAAALPTPPPPAPEPLKAGEVLYWHHLLRSGEIPPVSEDPRARVGALGSGTGANGKEAEGARRLAVPSGIVAGR